MKSLFGLITGLGILSALLFSAPVSDVFAQETVTIQGIVYADDWDDEGNVISVVIVADGVDYAVSASGKGGKLLAMEGKIIKATGTVKVNEMGQKTITVTSYEVIVEKSEVEEEKIIIEEE